MALQRTYLSVGLLFYLLVVTAAFPKWLPVCLAKTPGPETEVCASSAGDESLDEAGGGYGKVGSTIEAFLSKATTTLDNFHVQGWRWHTTSLVREAGRFDDLVQRQLVHSDEHASTERIEQAASYVIDFNLKGLQRIESETFFPWVRSKLTSVEDKQLSSAFGEMMDMLEDKSVQVSKVGKSITKNVAALKRATKSVKDRAKVLEGLASDSRALVKHTTWMLQTENQFLVPSIAEIVPSGEQKSFSNKVLKSLGIWDSRLHLVGMYEAIQNDAKEMELFQLEIPYIPRMMIPRWKRNLYDPQVSVLDN